MRLLFTLLLFTIIGSELDRKARHDRAYAA